MWIVISIAILAVLIVIGIIIAGAILKRNKEGKQQETNYRAFFIMGIALLPVGIALIVLSFTSDISITIGIPFFVISVTYIAIGLGNRDKWAKQ